MFADGNLLGSVKVKPETVCLKSGLVNLASKIDFAHFLCLSILSCASAKTTIRWIGSFSFSGF